MPFSFRRLSKFQLLALCGVACLTFVGFGIGKQGWFRDTNHNSQQAVIAAAPKVAAHVQRARLRPQLRDMMGVLGDRLEKPGKERLILTGTLSRASKRADKQPARLILEYPDKLRLEESDGVTIYKDDDFKSSKGDLKKDEQDEVESLLFDFVDHFFAGQMNGYATRILGLHFRMDDGKTPDYKGPYCALYQVTDRITIKKAVREQPKLFFFNSNTLLQEQVRYQIERNGKPINVEVQFGGWQKMNGQQIPTTLTRLENGASVLTLTVTAAAVGPRQDDGIFGLTQAR